MQKLSYHGSNSQIEPCRLRGCRTRPIPVYIYIYTHTRLTALCPGLPGWAGTRKVKPSWILLKQETVSSIDIRWAICKSAPSSREITMPAPHHSVFYRPDALPATQPTASKHWRHTIYAYIYSIHMQKSRSKVSWLNRQCKRMNRMNTINCCAFPVNLIGNYTSSTM